MPAVAELERLDAMVTRLRPLAAMRRGEPVESSDWNILVDAIIEIARAVLAEAQDATVAAHQHVDEVGLGWLQPGLRALVERGPLSDPASEGRLRKTERRVTRFDEQFGELKLALRNLREQLDGVVTRDVQRQAAVNRIDRQVKALPDAQEELIELRETLSRLREDIQTALTLSDGLEVDGEPVDMSAIVARLASVEALRESLTTADGQILDASAFEIQLAELNNRFVSRSELDEILDERTLELSDAQLNELQVALREELIASQSAALDEALEGFETRFGTQLDDRLEDVDARIATAVGDLAVDLRSSLQDTLGADVAAQIEARTGELEASLTDQVEAARGSIEQSLSSASAALRDELTEQLGAMRDAVTTVENGLEGFRERVGSIEANVDGLLANLGRFAEDMTTLSGRFGGLEEDIGGLDQRLGGMSGRLDQVDGRVASLGGRLDKAESGLVQIGARVGGVDRDLGTVASQLATFGAQFVGLQARVGALERRRLVVRGAPQLLMLDGIGPARERILRENGIDSVEIVAAADPLGLASILGVQLQLATEIVRHARRLTGM